ncbi:DUF551 domain-containing protein [Pasteurella multocida]|nr:DUF551 domain-containing protein [Pasteurella multocida]MDY0464478.1 DUF551 domain-containing protein [Pasteurella multocida]MDY0469048.1 DUF551 domain-containing protein [Pasteurella multocida]MDY0501244.1 DUF551 domain-containing protein [Pasteurella multocida]MDY0534342.1 DUF551 domain-containing protein [Pasteurella multocida]MDY0563885.1 DUF551 domain-containing protein [Pasteurella multocida]
MTGVTLIANERLRQQSEKGFSLNSDTQYTNDELVRAAMCYLQAQSRHAIMPIFWPWGKKYWNPKDRKENLIRAGALIAAEIDRLHNTTTKENEKRYLTMTETENKYFAVNIYDENSISFHKTEEEAKKACLNGAEELLDYTIEIDDISVYECQIHNAVYGVVLGKAESKTRDLNEEEKQSGLYDEIDYIVEHPKIVEYPKGDGWISVKDRLPEKSGMYLIYINPLLSKGTGAHQIRSDIYDTSLKEYGFTYDSVTHWKPLPPPPTE